MHLFKIKLTTIFLLGFLSFSFAQKQQYKIGILLDQQTERLNPLLQQLKEQIKAVVGEDASIYFSKDNILFNNFNVENAQNNYNTLLNNNTDIILAFGVINNIVVTNQINYPKPTILFGAINQDVSRLDLSKKTSQIKNFTYLIEWESFLSDLKTIRELTNFQNVGIAIEKPITEVLPLQQVFNKLFQQIDASYTIIPFENINDITQNLNKIDAIYLAGGFFLSDKDIEVLL